MLIGAVLLGLGTWFSAQLWWPLPFAFAALVVAANVSAHRDRRRLDAARSENSICTFARSFERRTVDPWIVRATYDALGPYCNYRMRADDRLAEDLGVDPEEIDFEVWDIAERACRSLEGASANPYFHHVATVRDLVLFLQHQPRVPVPCGAGGREVVRAGDRA